MANPQKEHGYTPISNEIMEAIARIRIPGEARQVLDVIIRKTYGWRKPADKISLSQYALATGLRRQNVLRAVSKLSTLNLIVIKKDSTKGNLYRLNKDFDTWRPLSKKRRGGLKKDNQLDSKKLHTKETITKETIYICSSSLTSLFEDIWGRYPKRIGKKQAIKSFEASVRNEKAWDNIQKALSNYLASERVAKGFVQNGATWFTNWQDWVEYTETRKTQWKTP